MKIYVVVDEVGWIGELGRKNWGFIPGIISEY